MLRKWFQRQKTQPLPDALYAAIVAQARQPDFYARLDVPDTVMGRFQMIALHVILVLDRLLDDSGAPEEQKPRQELARALQERMFDDMDASLRELGVSDLGVPRRMKKLAELFFGQLKAYREALGRDEAALQAVLARNIYAGVEPREESVRWLAAYARQARAALAQAGLADLRAGRVCWPPILPSTENGS